MSVYLDNAASTQIDAHVFEEMLPYLKENYGNPSAIHQQGRAARAAIEQSRKKIAELLNVSPAEIFFTSGGTEADNFAIRCCIETHGIKHVITSELEHKAVLNTLKILAASGKIHLHFVDHTHQGEIDLFHLEKLLKDQPKTLVSIMHGNNEIGNLNPIERIGELCCDHQAYFHTDTVQTMGHYVHDLKKLKVDYAVGSAHKFHGPKGIGFIYIKKDKKICPMITGGGQERKLRSGTENLPGIVGLAKALEIAYQNMASHKSHIESLKSLMIREMEQFDAIQFNGFSKDLNKSLYTVLSVSLPPEKCYDMFVFQLDMKGVAVSGGSACNSGADIGSHVLNALGNDPKKPTVRFSFGKYNTREEIEFTIQKLAELIKNKVGEEI